MLRRLALLALLIAAPVFAEPWDIGTYNRAHQDFGRSELPGGSVAAPTYSFQTNPTAARSGMWWDDSNTRICFSVNGATSACLDSAGLVTLLPGPGAVVFTDAAGGLAVDAANFHWDDALNRLGIGNAAPDSTFHVTGTEHVTGAVTLDSTLLVTGTTHLVGAVTLDTSLQVGAATNLLVTVPSATDARFTTNSGVVGVGTMFFAAGTSEVQLQSGSSFHPSTGSTTLDLGSSTLPWRTGYFGTSVATTLVQPAAAGGLQLASNGAFNLTLTTNGTGRWLIESTGNLITGADAAYHIGDSTHRPIDLFLSSGLSIGSNAVVAQGIVFPNGQDIRDTGANTFQVTNASWLPSSDNARDIGSVANSWKTGYFDTSVISVVVNATTGFQIAGAATSGRYLKGNGTNFVQSSGSASGTGACGAGTFVSTLNSDAAPTCTTPVYRSILTTSDTGEALNTGATTYAKLSGRSGASSTTEANQVSFLPIGVTMLNLRCKVTAAAGAGKSWIFTLRRNQTTDTAVTCTISGASATTCSDTVNSQVFSAGDEADYSIAPSGTPAAAAGKCGIEVDI
jgi:hypothetical protein